MLDYRPAAVALNAPAFHLNDLAQSLRDSGLPQVQHTAILMRAWKFTVQGTLKNGLPTLYREDTLYRHINHFGLTTKQLGGNRVITKSVKAGVFRDVTAGIAPKWQNINARLDPAQPDEVEKLVRIKQYRGFTRSRNNTEMPIKTQSQCLGRWKTLNTKAARNHLKRCIAKAEIPEGKTPKPILLASAD